MTKGKHSSAPTGALVRDLAVMAVLFVAAGTLAFGVIWWFQNRTDDPQAVNTTSATTAPPASSGPSLTTLPPTTTPVVTETTTAPLRAPAEITVLVLNAVGRAGIAGTLTDALAAAGYQMLSPDNYTPEVDTSKVWFRGGFQAEAHELAAFVPDAEVELNDDIEADIVVILGPTYQG